MRRVFLVAPADERDTATSSAVEVKEASAMRENLLDIGDMRRRSGLSASALRFYEAQGLIRSIARRGLRRLYDAGMIDRLAFISMAQAAGFSLAEIKALLGPDETDADLRRRLADKAEEIEARIAQLASMRDRLRHAARCPCRRLVDCPNFMRIMKSSLPFAKPSAALRCEAG
jgi:DNA-binding transcriptional MerR regulator